MKRSLKTLLDYAEQQAEHLEDLDQLVVCFAPSSDIRCLLLLDGKREKPCDKMWRSLLMAELVEEATSRIDDGKEPVACDDSSESDFITDVHTRIAVAQLSEGNCENIFKLSPLPCELPCTDQELPDEVRNGNSVECEQTKRNENGVVKIVTNSINDNAVQTNQPVLTTNYDQHAIESTILHHCVDSSNAMTDVHPYTDPNYSSLPKSFESGRSSRGSGTGESDGKKVEVSYSDCAQTVVVIEPQTNLLHRDANTTIGLNMYSEIPAHSLPQPQQQQYRPLQNRAPPASTYKPDILPSSSVQLSYQQFQEKQQKERLDLSMKEKMIATPSSKRVMPSSSSSLSSNTNAFSNDNSSNNNSNNYSNSNSNSSSSSSSSSKGNDNNIQHITSSFSAQQRSPLAGVDLQNLLECTMRCTDSSLQSGQSEYPLMKSVGTTHMLPSKEMNQMDADFSGPRVDQQDPLRFSEWPSWIWSRTFSYPLPSTAVIAAAGNDGGKVVYWMRQTIRFEDNLALEAAILLSKRVCLPLIVVYVTDAGSYGDLLNISMAAKEQCGRKSEGKREGEDLQGSYGLQGVHLSQQSYTRKSLITYSILESLSRSIKGLKVPLVCLTEGSAPMSKPMNENKGDGKGKDKDSDGSHNSSCRSTSTSSTKKESNSELHPTVSVLVDFFCSLPSSSSSSVHPSRSDVAGGRPANNQPLAAEEIIEKEKCGVFALFTDDTHHPLSAHITASLVARLPQLPVFCMDSNSIIPSSAAPDHFPGQLDTLAAVLDPLEGVDSKGSSASASTSTSTSTSSATALEELMRIFKSHCEVAATQCWDFGSNSVIAAPDDSVVGQDSPLHQALFYEEFSFSGVQCGDEQWMAWATVQDLLKSPQSQSVLAACESHTHSENMSSVPVRGRCVNGEGDDVTIAQLMMGTLSPRKAVSSMLSAPWGCEERDAAEQGVKDLSSCDNDAKAHIGPSSGDASGDDDKSKGCDSSRIDAVRHYLVQSDMLRYCCYRALKDGLLPVERVPAHITAIAAPAPRTAPHNAFRKIQEDNMGNGHRCESNGSSSSSSSRSGLSKWVIPWFRLLSPKAASALRKANAPKENLGVVYPADIRAASTDDDRFNHIQCVLMLHGVEPRGEKARYWVRFFLTHMGSRIMGLRTAIAELVEVYGDMVVRLLYQTSIVLRDLG